MSENYGHSLAPRSSRLSLVPAGVQGQDQESVVTVEDWTSSHAQVHLRIHMLLLLLLYCPSVLLFILPTSTIRIRKLAGVVDERCRAIESVLKSPISILYQHQHHHTNRVRTLSKGMHVTLNTTITPTTPQPIRLTLDYRYEQSQILYFCSHLLTPIHEHIRESVTFYT